VYAQPHCLKKKPENDKKFKLLFLATVHAGSVRTLQTVCLLLLVEKKYVNASTRNVLPPSVVRLRDRPSLSLPRRANLTPHPFDLQHRKIDRVLLRLQAQGQVADRSVEVLRHVAASFQAALERRLPAVQTCDLLLLRHLASVCGAQVRPQFGDQLFV